jgi:hypothetical protein
MLLPLVLAAALLAPAQGAPPPQAPAGSQPSAPKPAAPPPNLEAYQLVILQRPEHPRDYLDLVWIRSAGDGTGCGDYVRLTIACWAALARNPLRVM